MEHKQCSTCKETKRLTQFYKNRGQNDGRDNMCMVCRRRYQKAYNNKEAYCSTQEIQEILLEQGIPSIPASAANIPYIDLLAWGCVPVEAKGSNQLSRATGNPFFRFTISKHEKEDPIDGVFILLARYNSGHNRVFVLPTNDNYLFNAYLPAKSSFSFTENAPEFTRWGRLGYEDYVDYEAAYHLIEQYRVKIHNKLKGGLSLEESIRPQHTRSVQ